jgi:NodT family efflux transporter outer membrane factor (OMF) lipoprotein
MRNDEHTMTSRSTATPTTIATRSMATALVVAAACAIAGCAVGPAYQRADAPVSVHFKEADGWVAAVPADAMDRGAWWSLFGDPLLDGLASKVVVSNQNVAAAAAAYSRARALVREQRAALFPNVTLNGDATRNGGSGSASTRNQSYQVSIGSSWEPDVWGRLRAGVTNASASAQASQADLALATLSAQGELVTDYLALRETDAEIALYDATVAGYQRSLDITNNRYAAGIAPKTDLLQAQSQLSTAQADRAGLTQQRAQYEHAIAVLIGQAPGDFSLPPAAWSAAVPLVPPGLPSELLQRRPDIASAERQMAAANASIGIARSAYYPSFGLSGSLGSSAGRIGDLFGASTTLWSLGLSAAQTIFDAGAIRARVEEAQATYDQTVANYRQAVLTALSDVENQLSASRVLAIQYTLRQAASAQADESERLILNQYRAGQVVYTDVVASQAAALSARRALVQTTVSRQTTAVALIQSLGGGWNAAELDVAQR